MVEGKRDPLLDDVRFACTVLQKPACQARPALVNACVLAAPGRVVGGHRVHARGTMLARAGRWRNGRHQRPVA
eukprot:8774159-Alexandrium_andersonii.AAC.3